MEKSVSDGAVKFKDSQISQMKGTLSVQNCDLCQRFSSGHSSFTKQETLFVVGA